MVLWILDRVLSWIAYYATTLTTADILTQLTNYRASKKSLYIFEYSVVTPIFGTEYRYVLPLRSDAGYTLSPLNQGRIRMPVATLPP